jgi:Calcineurin-like phosphoesterase
VTRTLPPGNFRGHQLWRVSRTGARWTILVAVLGLSSALVPPPVSRAAALADEIHYAFTGPRSVAFDWRGQADDIRYGLTSAYTETVLAHTPNPLPQSSAGPFWEVQLRRLRKGTIYHYSIGGSPDQTFSTKPTDNYRFDVEADIGDSLSDPEMLPIQEQIAADHPSFVLAPGDLAYGDTHGVAAVDQHFNDVMAWSQTSAYLPMWGNHEWDPSTAADELRDYKGRFRFANDQASPGAPADSCCGEDWGWFDAGGVRFISYPEPYTSLTWPDWAQRADALMAHAQSDASIHFIVTWGHRPAYSTGHHEGDPALASILDGLGDRYPKYVVNFNGHSHDYERFEPIHGVVHITTGGGGAGIEPPWMSSDPRTAFRAMHHEYLRVGVTTTSMRIKAVCGPASTEDDLVCDQGTVIDAVTIAATRN